MYAAYFGLNEDPYAIAPDPRYFFLSKRHREALTQLINGLEHSGGFVQLTGEIGTGKTTICRSLVESAHDNVDVALILEPGRSAGEVLLAICKQLRIDLPHGRLTGKQAISRLKSYLLEINARSRRTVLIIDEAQNLSTKALTLIGRLTDLEANGQKLLRIFLIGRPELRTNLSQKSLSDLAQCCTMRYHLEPLSADETVEYIRHRLDVAGGVKMLFTAAAVREIHRRSGGVPRTINILCDRAMLGAYVTGKERVNARIVRNSALEIAGKAARHPEQWWSPYAWAAAALFAVCSVALSGYFISGAHTKHRPEDVAHTAHAAKPAAAPSSKAPKVAATTIAAALPAPASTVVPPTPARHKAAAGLPAAAKVVAAPPSAVPSVAALLAQAQSRSAAERRLASRWGLSYPEAGAQPLCNWAAGHGLQCLERQGSWASLQRLNRPAMLWLTDGSDGISYGVVESLTADRVRLALGSHEESIALDQLKPYWHGQFLLLWKPPVPSVDVIRKGAPPAAVRWLRTALNKVQGQPTLDEHAGGYSWPVLKQVMAFQRRVGLPVDGTVGAETLIMLTTAIGNPRTPVISPPPAIAQVVKGD